MSSTMQILILLGTFISVIYILLRIHNLKIKMEDTIFWICFSIVVLVLGTNPKIVFGLSEILGIRSPINLVYLIIIGLLVEKLFTVSVTLSLLEEKVMILSAELAIQSRDAAIGREKLSEEIEKQKEDEKNGETKEKSI